MSSDFRKNGAFEASQFFGSARIGFRSNFVNVVVGMDLTS